MIIKNENELKYVVYAHRGASAYAPENTIVSFKKALELGSNGIELDLQETKDGKIVIFHDDFIDNKSNGKGKISDYTYEELLKLDFGEWFDIKYKGEKIVLFEDFAKEFFNIDLTFAIEIKVAKIENKVLKIINKYRKDSDIYITSEFYQYLENMRKIDKNIKLSYIVDEINEDNIKELLKIDGNQIVPKAENVSEKAIEYANKKGIGVRLWGVFNENIMKKVYKLNIEGMTVNFPDKLIKLLKDSI